MRTPPPRPAGAHQPPGDSETVLRNARASLTNLRQAVENTQQVIRDLEQLTGQLQAQHAPQPALQHTPPLPPEHEPQAQPQPQAQQSPVQQPRPQQEAPPQLAFARSHSARPQLTTEQLIMRIIAVLGSLITVIGVGLGITLAIQSGLLGPLGRVILSVLLAALLGVSALAIERKRGANTGSTALYITSHIVLVLVILALVSWLEWWTWQTGAIAALVLFTAFLALGRWRRNGALSVAVIIIAFCYFPSFVRDGTHVDALVYLAPLIALFFTVSAPGKPPVPLAGALRVLASLLAFFLYAIIAAFGPGAPAPVFFIALSYALIAVAIEAAFPPPPRPPLAPLPGTTVDSSRVLVQVPRTHRAQLTVFPILSLVAALIHADGIYLWAFPIAAAVAFYLVEHAYRTAPALGSRRCEALTWLVFGAATFAIVYDGSGLGTDADIRRFLTLAVFLATFFGIILLLEQRPQYREVTWVAWTAAALYLTRDVSGAVLGLRESALVDGAVQLQAVCLALLLGFALWRHEAFKSMHPAVLVLAGIAGMYLYMVAAVSFTTFTFHIFGAAELGVIVGHMLVSITWIVLAAWILLGTTRWPDKVTLRVGFILAIAASIKLVFYDLSSLSGIPQVLAFIASGIMLIVIAALRGRNTPSRETLDDEQRSAQQPTAQQLTAEQLTAEQTS